MHLFLYPSFVWLTLGFAILPASHSFARAAEVMVLVSNGENGPKRDRLQASQATATH